MRYSITNTTVCTGVYLESNCVISNPTRSVSHTVAMLSYLKFADMHTDTACIAANFEYQQEYFKARAVRHSATVYITIVWVFTLWRHVDRLTCLAGVYGFIRTLVTQVIVATTCCQLYSLCDRKCVKYVTLLQKYNVIELTLCMLGNFFKYFFSFKRCKKSLFPPKYCAAI